MPFTIISFIKKNIFFFISSFFLEVNRFFIDCLNCLTWDKIVLSKKVNFGSKIKSKKNIYKKMHMKNKKKTKKMPGWFFEEKTGFC